MVHQMAFIGWPPDQWGHGALGPKFAGKTEGGIKPGDVVLIARRFNGKPEMVGFGQVIGEAETTTDIELPEEWTGSLRKLQPFTSWSLAPVGVPLSQVVRHTKALVELHPQRNEEHRQVCEWMDAQLAAATREQRQSPSSARSGHSMLRAVKVVSSPNNRQLDYIVQTKAFISKAQKKEAELLEAYAQWLQTRGRALKAAKYGQLQCDGIEIMEGTSDRVNLIEAKCSASREHVRMAVGQLLDYGFQGRHEYPAPHKAILLPHSPSPDIIEWLESINIKVIWRSGVVFLDNDNGGFI